MIINSFRLPMKPGKSMMRPKFSIGNNRKLVLTDETVPVATVEFIVRTGLGRALCTICNRHFNNDAKSRLSHLDTLIHKNNAENKLNIGS